MRASRQGAEGTSSVNSSQSPFSHLTAILGTHVPDTEDTREGKGHPPSVYKTINGYNCASHPEKQSKKVNCQLAAKNPLCQTQCSINQISFAYNWAILEPDPLCM